MSRWWDLIRKSARVVKELFRQKAAQGTTIFLSTHSMEIAEQLCDRVAIIVDGAVIALGSIAELKQSARHQDAHLEDIFLHLTGVRRNAFGDHRASIKRAD